MTAPAMSADDARTFDGYSLVNAGIVQVALAERGCSCQPYNDVFTFARWRAQGHTVRKGEHGIRLVVYVTAGATAQEVQDTTYDPRLEAPRAQRERTYPRPSYVFCRCQTEEVTR